MDKLMYCNLDCWLLYLRAPESRILMSGWSTDDDVLNQKQLNLTQVNMVVVKIIFVNQTLIVSHVTRSRVRELCQNGN